jgi:hypothetical protein
MLNRSSRIAAYLTKAAGNRLKALGLAAGVGAVGGGVVAADDIKRGLAGMSQRQTNLRRMYGFPNTPKIKPRYGYGALRSSLNKRF